MSKKTTRATPPKLAVVEIAAWYGRDNVTSIKPLLQVLGQTLKNKPTDFLHSTFVDKDSFSSTMKCYAETRGVKYIYIACHGDEQNLWGIRDEDVISSTIVKKGLKTEKAKGITGLYFGTCEFVTNAAPKILRGKRVKWVAGYKKSPDWMDSSAFDLLFWSEVLRKKKEPNIEYVVEKLQKRCGGLIHELGFQLYVRKPRTRNNEVINLVTEEIFQG